MVYLSFRLSVYLTVRPDAGQSVSESFLVWLQLYHVKCTSISLCKGCKTLFLCYPDYNFFSDVFTTNEYASIGGKVTSYFCVIYQYLYNIQDNLIFGNRLARDIINTETENFLGKHQNGLTAYSILLFWWIQLSMGYLGYFVAAQCLMNVTSFDNMVYEWISYDKRGVDNYIM